MSMIDARRDASVRLRAASAATRWPSGGLRQRLVGTWRLVCCIARDLESGEETHPLGEHPLGLIMYTPDGFMSAQLSAANRSPFRCSDPRGGTPAECAEAGNSYIAYAGPFYVDELKASLIHEMQLSLFPNWLAQRQVRLVQIDGDLLRLATTPMSFGGTRKIVTLVWRRARPNFARPPRTPPALQP
jgi:DNA-binding transcriptional LysR family regulator